MQVGGDARSARRGSCRPRRCRRASANTIGLSVAALASICERGARVREGVARRAVHLRRAAHRVGVLHAAAVLVRRVDRARPGAARSRLAADGALARMRPRVVQPRLERMIRAAQPVDRQRGGDVGGAREPLGAEQRQRRDRGGRLGAVDEREPFLGARASPAARPARASAARAVEHGRIGRRRSPWPSPISTSDEVRERREVAAGADRSAARHDRVDARVERVDQPVERRAPDAGVALREHVGAQRHHRAHRARRQRLADAGRVAAQQVALQLAERVPAES